MKTMIQSLKKNKTGILLMMVSSFCVCFGQLFWKLSAEYGVAALLLGFFLYSIGALIMIISYRYGSLSVLQPIMSMSYVIAFLLSIFVLDEQVSVYKIAGIIIIMTGVAFIAGGDE